LAKLQGNDPDPKTTVRQKQTEWLPLLPSFGDITSALSEQDDYHRGRITDLEAERAK
jgi:hypothetical protein